MTMDDDMLKQLMASFREELAERLAAINAGLLALEQGAEPAQQTALLEELFRHVHSLKGAARAVNLKPIEEMAHGMEDVFGAAKRGTVVLSAPLFDLLYQGLDLIGAVMSSIEASGQVDPSLDLPGYLVRLAAAWRGQPIQPPQIESVSLPPRVSPPSPHRPAVEREGVSLDVGEGLAWATETIRVPTARLDDLLNQSGELLVSRLRIAQQVEELDALRALLTRWQKEWQRVRNAIAPLLRQAEPGSGRVLANFLQQNEGYLQTASEWLDRYARRISEDAARLALVSDQLQERVKQVRMLPLATLVAPLRRMVRDLARDKGVEVALEVHGADTEMDKQVLEQIKDPLIHLLRNCVDHGIEPPKEREKLGKPAQGTITLRAERQGNVVVIEVSDDGRGIDLEAVRQAAVRRGFLSPEVAPTLTAEEINALLFLPGLSTSPMVTDVSGRGIGLDVVRRNVEAMQGQVRINSLPRRGTTITLTLPFTLASTRCLLLRAGEQTFAVPMASVERMVAVKKNDIFPVAGREVIRYQGKPLSLVRLADVLQLEKRGKALENGEKAPAVVLAAGDQRVAFLVDELLGEEELLVKSLGRHLSRVPGIAGATILGTGRVILILNAADLIKKAQQAPSPSPLPATAGEEKGLARPTILIVDDSITTRTLEKNILTTAGYQVRLAYDGEEALQVLAEGGCDLVVADIDMPRMDGFELTRRLKNDERYRDLPVILVTSMGSPEDKARGIAVGADAYIVKSSFDQDNLLETIRQLI